MSPGSDQLHWQLFFLRRLSLNTCRETSSEMIIGGESHELSRCPQRKTFSYDAAVCSDQEKYSDCIVFFRLGDFYEMFFEDAILVSRELELTLTGKECGLEERAPMCGVPYHSVELYLKRLVDKGYKIAICEQMTDPALSKGLVERDVIRIVTPGTLIESSMLEDDSNSDICTLYYGNDGSCALCFADLSTGEMCPDSTTGSI